MWCEKCQTDVGTEVAPDNRRVLCAICGHALGETATSQLDQPRRPSRTTEARELLDRWANSRPLDPFGPPKKRVTEDNLAASPASATPSPTLPLASDLAPIAAMPDPPDDFGTSHLQTTRASDVTVNAELDRLANEIMSRVDKLTRGPTDSLEPPTTQRIVAAPQFEISELKSEISNSRSEISDVKFQISDVRSDLRSEFLDLKSPLGSSDQQPSSAPVAQPSVLKSESSDLRSQTDLNAPLPRPVTAPLPLLDRKPNLLGNVGQCLTYVGILGLTAGLCLVIFGYFGGPANFAPTGWLITTLGQMLLFLGVVTLVSVGMEQTRAEVRSAVEERMNSVVERIERLGDEIVRIEHRGHGSNAPHFTQRTFGEPEGVSPRTGQNGENAVSRPLGPSEG